MTYGKEIALQQSCQGDIPKQSMPHFQLHYTRKNETLCYVINQVSIETQ